MTIKNYGPWTCESDPAWKRRAAEALRESRAMLDRIPPAMRDPGDPNHPMHDGIFGYDRQSFLARQY